MYYLPHVFPIDCNRALVNFNYPKISMQTKKSRVINSTELDEDINDMK